MSNTPRLIENAEAYPVGYEATRIRTAAPSLGVAVVACMDARLDLFALLGLKLGEVHMIRNAGGLVTDDAIRSLVLSQRALGTREIILIHHTNCGLDGLDDEQFLDSMTRETGQTPPWRPGGFTDVEQDVRDAIAAVRDNPFLISKEVRGFVFDVDDGSLREVT